MTIDINGLSLKELKELQMQLVKSIASFEDRKKKEALAEIEEFARARGFSLAELTGTTVMRKRSPAVPKYANPANSSETWSGRGRKPHWFAAALAAGKQPDEMTI